VLGKMHDCLILRHFRVFFFLAMLCGESLKRRMIWIRYAFRQIVFVFAFRRDASGACAGRRVR
jgi:hypothetical protein